MFRSRRAQRQEEDGIPARDLQAPYTLRHQQKADHGQPSHEGPNSDQRLEGNSLGVEDLGEKPQSSPDGGRRRDRERPEQSVFGRAQEVLPRFFSASGTYRINLPSTQVLPMNRELVETLPGAHL
jgi:hypothetical protein